MSAEGEGVEGGEEGGVRWPLFVVVRCEVEIV